MDRVPMPSIIFFFQAEDGIRDSSVTGVQTCALPICFWELFRPGLIACFAVGFVIGAAWYVAGYEVGGKHFLGWQFGMNLWKRFIPAEEGGGGYCVHPFYYFVPPTLIGFLPWSLYLPAAGVWIWPSRP